MSAYQKIAQMLHVLPSEPLHIAGMSFTKPAPLTAYTPPPVSGVCAWVALPANGAVARIEAGNVVYAHGSRDLSVPDAEVRQALSKWKELGHSEQELHVVVHHMPRALDVNLRSVERRLVELLFPVLNQSTTH
jgi:hypothetical protein